MKRQTAMAAGAAMAVLTSGCGGSSHHAPRATGPPQAQVRANWTAFFDGKTPAGEKIALLQNGQRFASVIKAQSKSALAKQTKAKVVSVTLEGAARAKVVYSILLGGTPALKHQVGRSVRSNGVWQVADRSFCMLLALQGPPPAGCPKSGVG